VSLTPEETAEAARLILDLREEGAHQERQAICDALGKIGDELGRTTFGRSLSGVIYDIERYIRTRSYLPKDGE
jgi:hypothetical protein